MTPATIYRIVHETQPTMLIDEYDSHGAGSEAMRNIMNAAHEKEFAWIDRCDANTNEPQRFRAWAAIAVAGIGQLPGTLADRSIIIPMQRRKASEQIADLSEDEAKAELHQLQRMAYRWAQDNAEAVHAHKPEKLPWLINRDADNWKVALRIADIVGARWPALAREAAHHFVVEVEREDSRAIQLISDIKEMFVGHGPECRQLQSNTIVTNLLNMEERPYNEWTRQGKPINKTTLASALKPYEVYPDGLHFPELQKTLRGYHRSQVEEAHERYVGAGKNGSAPHTPDSTCKTVRTPGNPPVSGDSRVQELTGNLTSENAKKPEKTATSYSLTGESGGREQKTKNTTPTEEPEHEPHIWGDEWEEAI